MNIIFKEIEINNFRSIQEAKVVLNEQGIVIVKGINEYEDKASSNGSGKSSIFEALIFAIFEETSTGEKDVANRILNKGYYIRLSFNIDGVNYVIIRKNDGKKSEVGLLKDGKEISARNKTDTNKLIISILGINKSVFLDSIYLSQGANTNLASLTPTARKERLEILTNTDNVINSFKEKLKQKQIEYESKCVDWEKQNAEIEGKLSTLFAQEEVYRNKILEIEKQIEYRNSLGNLDLIENQIVDIQKSLNDKKLELKDFEEKLKLKREEFDKFKDTYKDLLKQKNEKDTQYQTEKLNLTAIKSKLSLMNLKISNLESDIEKENKEITKILSSDKCPTCGRKYDNVNEEHIKLVVDEHKQNIVKLEEEIELKNSEKENCRIEENQQNQIIDNKLQELNEINKLLENVEEEGKNLNNLISQLEESRNSIIECINDYEAGLENLRCKKDEILKVEVGSKKEFEDLLQESAKQNLKLQDEKVKICTSYDEDNNCVGTLKHCQQLVTKEFRVYLLKNSIDYLNTLLKNYSKALFSNDKDVINIIGDDTKLEINLGNSNYESLSGGEKTRVNIALLLAQKSLANILGNISCNIIILDEVLGYCDSAAEVNVINLITKELNSLETIYMISHKEIPIGYDSELIIKKDFNGLSNIVGM